ncbi:MAG: tyrosine-type recombinase/integrase [Candidatus Omnitrophota bacterium]
MELGGSTIGKKTAERILTKIETQIIENRYLDIKKEPRIKFEDFVQEYLKIHSERKKSYHTDLQITNRLTRYFGDKYLSEIRQIDIERFKTERTKQVKPGTVNRELSVLKSMFSRAVEWSRAIENSAKGVKKFKENNRRQRCLAYEEEDKLLANCNERIKPIVLVALHTGMRKGEILKLKWQDVDIQNRVIHLLDTKNGEARDVPMNNTAIDTLRKIIKHPTSEYIFCNKGGKLYGDIKKSFLSAIEKAGIINFRFHDLRHTFISRLMMAGVDLASLTEIAGHKSVKMTIRYSHPSPDHKLQVVGILDREMGTRWAPSISNTPTEKILILQPIENK